MSETIGVAREMAGSERLERATLGSQIADVLRREIIFGHLKPGERLGQHQLCERFGTSRMPVRDALRQLNYEGFLAEDGGRHLVVVRMRREDIRDTYEIEGMLHGLATRRVATRGDAGELAELRDFHEKMLARQDELPAMAELNWRFHRRINHFAASQKLVAALRSLALQIPRDYLVEFPAWAGRANDEHAGIVDAIAAGRATEAESLMREHVLAAGEYLIDFLQTSGVDLD
ncbi:GntR family transcriptional regulator [Amycolatopsis antarctica]|uniref:GntR family transcriptional regulator n=1 Tax=Amycolatopsis antarctica TaxID=1854586 RepID=A0A263D402_9PSEU|nr:GntR family transcriptional regulator [Amycolatopsis antarctica]OZM72085.1 GntR family transcriptional regulator [Amycolatopsis antarctica]